MRRTIAALGRTGKDGVEEKNGRRAGEVGCTQEELLVATLVIGENIARVRVCVCVGVRSSSSVTKDRGRLSGQFRGVAN